MSGHSHAKTVQHTKGAADVKRSQIFSKLAQEIAIAARENPDAAANPRLRQIIEKARDFNMPTENIERAIKKSIQGEGTEQLEEILFEAYGPGGIALLVSCITDNRNRTLGEIKQILNKNQSKLVEGGAVRWLFEWRGVVSTPKKEGVELAAIESGADDFFWQDNELEIYTSPANLEQVRQNLVQKGFTIDSATAEWVPKERIEVSQQDRIAAESLFEALDENNDVQDIYSNLKS